MLQKGEHGTASAEYFPESQTPGTSYELQNMINTHVSTAHIISHGAQDPSADHRTTPSHEAPRTPPCLFGAGKTNQLLAPGGTSLHLAGPAARKPQACPPLHLLRSRSSLGALIQDFHCLRSSHPAAQRHSQHAHLLLAHWEGLQVQAPAHLCEPLRSCR